MASLKSHTAFKFNVERLFESSRSGVYFWTSTFEKVLTVKEASQRWPAFAKELVRELGLFGVRVYELHDEHGLRPRSCSPLVPSSLAVMNRCASPAQRISRLSFARSALGRSKRRKTCV